MASQNKNNIGILRALLQAGAVCITGLASVEPTLLKMMIGEGGC